MKKSIILFLIFFIIALVVFFTVHDNIENTKDKVNVTESVIFGNRNKAKGITITSNTHYKNHLFWDTMYSIENEVTVNSSFVFSQTEKQSNKKLIEAVYIYTDFNYGISSTGGINIDDEFGILAEPIKYIADRTKPGETHEEQIKLADYFKYYPLNLYVESNERIDTDSSPQGGTNDYSSYFKIPVKPEHTITVSVKKNENGIVNGINCMDSENYISINNYGIITDSGIYLAISTIANDNSNKYIEITPEINGIHFLPFSEQKSATSRKLIDLSKAKLVYTIDNNATVFALKRNIDNSRLLMITNNSGELSLSVIDASTMELLQNIELSVISDYYISNIKQYDNFIVIISDNGQFDMLSYKNGLYTLNMSDSFADDEIFPEKPPYYKMEFDYDGIRLAATSYKRYMHSCSNFILIYEEDGLKYIGEYICSLDAKNQSLQMVKPFNGDSISIKIK